MSLLTLTLTQILVGGVWVEDTKGLTTVSAYRNNETDPNNNAKIYIKQGETLGEANHTLTSDEIPPHYHRVSIANGSERIYSFSPTGVTGDSSQYANLLYSGGNGKSHNTQPSIGVYKWHRIE